MGALAHISTASLAPECAVTDWNEAIATVYKGCEVGTADNGPIDAAFWYWSIGSVHLLRSRSSRSTVRSSGNESHLGDRQIKAYMQQHGSSEFSRNGKTTVLGPGDMWVLEPSAPYSVRTSRDSDLLMLTMPLDSFAHDAETAASGLRMAREVPAATRLRNFVLSLWNEASVGDALPGGKDLESILIGMMRMATSPQSSPRAETSIGNYSQIVKWIEHRIADPDLSLAMISRHTGYAPRTLQAMFARHGTTPTKLVLKMRLNRSCRLLQLEQSASITDIALAVGFGDASYYGRRFRMAYGISPREFRGKHAEQSDDSS